MQLFQTLIHDALLLLAVAFSLCLVIVFALIGDWSLRSPFAVTIDEFKIAGGILLFIVAVRGVMSGIGSYTDSPGDRCMMAIFPLAFPIIAGPGTLAVTIILVQSDGSIQMLTASLMTFLVVFLIARNAHPLMRLVGPYGGMIIPRLLYVFLASKAVAMVLEGTVTFLKENIP